jgi:hypothetical protein
MRFYPAEPDIATVFNRIQDGDIDLQPDFQRGEVWPVSKQQRLVDSILRGWIVPPILVISEGQQTQQVLDGQQRLASIRDFKLDLFPVNGLVDPPNPDIEALHGLTFRQLPLEVQKRFDKSTVRIFEVSDFLPEEPAEIFFRLNQPTALTAAEKRNAFFGPVRSQIKQLVSENGYKLETTGILGFTNSRMAYDEILARFLCTVEFGSLVKKVTASEVDELYRRSTPASNSSVVRLAETVDLLARVVDISIPRRASISGPRIKLNRATCHSWFLFLARLDGSYDVEKLGSFFNYFEYVRQSLASDYMAPDSVTIRENGEAVLPEILSVFNNRVASRINDASSVVLRDLILWLGWIYYTDAKGTGCRDPSYSQLVDRYRENPAIATEPYEYHLLDMADKLGWGVSF